LESGGSLRENGIWILTIPVLAKFDPAPAQTGEFVIVRYGYADVGRFGLGHGLLAWARCIVWCHDTGAIPIAPHWFRLRIGPILRNERDKRLYFLLFGCADQLSGLRRLLLLLRAPQVSAQGELEKLPQLPNDVPLPDASLANGSVMIFVNSPSQNEAKFFHQIYGRHALVRAALTKMTKKRYRPQPMDFPHIAIHVRGGDFGTAATSEQLKSGKHNQRLPESWYVEMLQILRSRIGSAWPAVLYSDCSDQEVSLLLTQPSIKRAPPQQSITDMLAMGQATVMISSGSGFSRWAAYLGQVPRLCYPGQRGVRVIESGTTGDNSVELEPEVELSSEISFEFVAEVQRRAKGVI
jgi:hypothetical protein